MAKLSEGITTIIYTHYSSCKARSDFSETSLLSLIDSTKNLPCEIIVIDNGGFKDDSRFFLSKLKKGEITHYLKNHDNLWFGRARNQGVSLSTGHYLVFTDNDIIFKDSWLERCIFVLDKSPRDKLFVTPLEVDRAHRQTKYAREAIVIEEKAYTVNAFAGSNCWLMYRKDFDIVGGFMDHKIAGTRWCQRYERMGYAVITLRFPYAHHMGLEKTPLQGYNKGEVVSIDKTFTNGEKINYYNG